MWYYILLIILIAILALRYRVGGDTLIYMDEYDSMPTIAEVEYYMKFAGERYQILWVLLIAFLKSVSNDFVLLQIVHAIIVNVVFFSVFKKYTTNKYLALLLYFTHAFFVYNFEVIREALAICIFLLSWPLCNNQKWGKYIICALLAFFVHDSAIIIFLLPLLFGRRPRLFVLIPLAIISAMMSSYILKYMSFLGVGMELIERAGTYLESGSVFNVNWLIYHCGIKLIIPYVIYMLANRINMKTKVDNFAMFYFVCAIISVFIPHLNRFYNYIIPISIIYLCQFLSQIRFRSYKNILYGVKNILSVSIICFVLLYRVGGHFSDMSYLVPRTHRYNLYYPYKTIFNPETCVEREELNMALRNLSL